MNVIHHIKIDMKSTMITPDIRVMQLDCNSRIIQAELLCGNTPFALAENAEISFACIKPDRTKCWYDQLPNGEPAATVQGNIVSVALAPEVLTVAGAVKASIVIRNDISNQLSTFPFVILILPNPAVGSVISNDYYKITSIETLNAWAKALEEKYDTIWDKLSSPPIKYIDSTTASPPLVLLDLGPGAYVLNGTFSANGNVEGNQYAFDNTFVQIEQTGANQISVIYLLSDGWQCIDINESGSAVRRMNWEDMGSNVPITYINSTDPDNCPTLRSLESGICICNGYFAYYDGSNTINFTSNTLLHIFRNDTKSTISMHKSASIHIFTITDSDYTKTSIDLPNFESRMKAAENSILEANDTVGQITKKMELISIDPVNLYNAAEYTLGYVSVYGEVFESGTLQYSPKIPVTEGDVFHFYSKDGNGVEVRPCRLICAYSSDGTAVSDAGTQNTATYTVPSGVTHIVISLSSAYTWMITKNYEATEYVAYVTPEKYYKATPEFVGIASQNNFGLVKVWSEEIDGEKILHISTEV